MKPIQRPTFRLIWQLQRSQASDASSLQSELRACRREVSVLRAELDVLRARPTRAMGTSAAAPTAPCETAVSSAHLLGEIQAVRAQAEKAEREMRAAVWELKAESRRCSMQVRAARSEADRAAACSGGTEDLELRLRAVEERAMKTVPV